MRTPNGLRIDYVNNCGDWLTWIKNVQDEAWNSALKEVDALMQKPCWDLTLCEELKKLKK